MLAILDYDAGNIESVRSAVAHVGGEATFVRDAAQAAQAERIIFPGVGSAAQCMRNLHARKFDKVLADAVTNGTPVLAICIGMQLLFDRSEEDEGVEALGLLPGKVVKFSPQDTMTKVPHMGWNRTEMPLRHPLLPETLPGADYYFVHSYYVQPEWKNSEATDTAKPATYGLTGYSDVRFTAMAGKGSLFACQFHPEKSGEAGLDILRRFLQWNGKPATPESAPEDGTC